MQVRDQKHLSMSPGAGSARSTLLRLGLAGEMGLVPESEVQDPADLLHVTRVVLKAQERHHSRSKGKASLQ